MSEMITIIIISTTAIIAVYHAYGANAFVLYPVLTRFTILAKYFSSGKETFDLRYKCRNNRTECNQVLSLLPPAYLTNARYLLALSQCKYLSPSYQKANLVASDTQSVIRVPAGMLNDSRIVISSSLRDSRCLASVSSFL